MIYDSDNNAILSAEYDLESQRDKTFTVKIDCEDGHFLRCNLSDITVEAAKVGESFVNIQETPIDLSAYSGLTQPVSFEIRTTAPEVSSYDREDIKIAVGRIVAPDGVDNFAATVQDSSSILTTWDLPTDSSNVAGYQTRTNIPSMAVVNQTHDVGYNFENLTVGINPATECFFEIRAYNINGDYSVWSEQISATTDA